MALLHMHDFLTITKADSRYPTKMADTKSLFVKVHATHAGTINGNYRFYRPDSMQKATHTWLPFGAPKRPVIINHKEDSEVLGRVVEAKYVRESYKWAADFPTIKDSLFYKTDGKKINLFESVDWVVDNLVGQKGYTGLGAIELGLSISNPEAIEKVLRDEYLTVSVGFTTDSAICSHCHQDWATDDRCDHNPGEMQDGKQVFLICSPKAYDEVSFVTFPADPFASVFSKEALKDSLKRISYLGLPINKRKVDKKFSDSLFTSDIHPAEDTMDNLEQLISEGKFDTILAEMKSDNLTLDIANGLRAGLAKWTPESEDLKTRKRSLQSTLNAQIRKKDLDKTSVENVNPEVLTAVAEPTKTEAGQVSLDSVAEADRDYFSDAEGILGEIEIALENIDNSAKLTAEQKAALKASDFAGPNGTFPILNAAMASAAINVVEDSKLSEETKLKLINAISAKKAEFKTVEAPKDAKVAAIEVTDKISGFATDRLKDSGKEVLGLFTQIDSAYNAADDDLKSDIKSLVDAMHRDWYADGYVDHAKSVLETKDFAVIPAQDLSDKEEAVNSLTDQVSNLKGSLESQKKLVNSMLDTYKRSLATQIVIAKIMKGQDGFTELSQADRTEKVETLSKRHVEYLKDTVKDLLSEAKFEETKAGEKTEESVGVTVSDSAAVNESKSTTTATTTTAMTDTKHVVDIPLYLTPSERKTAQLLAAYEATRKQG